MNRAMKSLPPPRGERDDQRDGVRRVCVVLGVNGAGAVQGERDDGGSDEPVHAISMSISGAYCCPPWLSLSSTSLWKRGRGMDALKASALGTTKNFTCSGGSRESAAATSAEERK